MGVPLCFFILILPKDVWKIDFIFIVENVEILKKFGSVIYKENFIR